MEFRFENPWGKFPFKIGGEYEAGRERPLTWRLTPFFLGFTGCILTGPWSNSKQDLNLKKKKIKTKWFHMYNLMIYGFAEEEKYIYIAIEF